MITEIISKLKQGFEELEKGNFEKAKNIFEEILKKDSKNGQVYAGLLLAEKGLKKLSDLEKQDEPFDSSENYKKAMLYGGKDLTAALSHCLGVINKRNEKAARAKEREEREKAEREAEIEKAKKSKSDWQKKAEKEQELLASSIRLKTKNKQKKKKRQKIIAVILSFFVVFSALSVFLFAGAEEKKELEKAEKLLSDGNYAEAYMLFSKLEKSEMLESIKNNAESYALSLANEGNYEEAAELLELTEKTDTDVFSGCKSVLAGDYKKAVDSGLTSLVLPEGISQISPEAFFGCDAFESIVIPEGVTRIGAFAFEDCTSLKKAVLPSTVTEIEENAFYGCSSLTEIIIPKNVSFIGRMAFAKCPLSKIVFEDGSNWTADGTTYVIKDEAQAAKDISGSFSGTWKKSK